MTPWTVARQAPLSMGSSRQEYWSGLAFHSPGDLPDPGIEPEPSSLQADSLPSEPPGKPEEYLSKSPNEGRMTHGKAERRGLQVGGISVQRPWGRSGVGGRAAGESAILGGWMGSCQDFRFYVE